MLNNRLGNNTNRLINWLNSKLVQVLTCEGVNDYNQSLSKYMLRF